MTDIPRSGPSLSFVKLVVPDLNAAERFYAAALDLARVGSFDTDQFEEVMLRGARGATLILFRWTDNGTPAEASHVGPIGFEVDDINLWYGRAIAAGGQPLRPPEHASDAMQVAFFRDPNGQEIELIAFARRQ